MTVNGHLEKSQKEYENKIARGKGAVGLTQQEIDKFRADLRQAGKND